MISPIPLAYSCKEQQNENYSKSNSNCYSKVKFTLVENFALL
jgi:hypothetical protein